MKALNESQIIVGPVRFSYMHVFKPRRNANKDSQPLEYSVMLLFPKNNNEFQPNAQEEIEAVKAFILNIAKQKFGDVKGIKFPLKDGDKLFDADGNAKHPGYWVLSTMSGEEYPPKLVDGRKQPVIGGWSSGDWGKVFLSIFAYSKGSKGVSAGLRQIQFLYKGEPLGGASTAPVDAFDEEPNAHIASTTAAPQEDEYDPFADE